VTLNVNSLGAKNVNKFGSVALVAGEIRSLSTVTVVYDGTNFQITGVAQPGSLAASGWQRLSSGLLIQWGTAVASTTAGATNTTALPVAYSSAQFRTLAICGEGTGGTIVNMTEAGQSSLSTFQWTINATGLSRINFISIGI
jgi:hypothetical protein